MAERTAFVVSLIWPENAWMLLVAASFAYAAWVAEGVRR